MFGVGIEGRIDLTSEGCSEEKEADCFTQLQGRGGSPGDSRVARRLAGETDLHQKLKVVTFLFSNRTCSSNEKGSLENALR